MGLIGSIVIGMSVNTNQFKQGLDKSSGQLDKFASKGAATAEKFHGGISASTALLGGLAVAGVAVGVGFLAKGIKNAINLGETLSKTKEIFGDATGSVTAQADDMAKKFGLTKQPLLDAASSFGLVGQAAGQTESEAAKFANTFTKLAADASSFYNVPLEDALLKIRSGLTGESEPLHALGVFLTEDAVKAEALRLGLTKGKGALDEHAKVAARASLIQGGLAKATGDLERTQGSAANQFRKAGGGIDNFATSMGEILLPAVTSAIGGFNELGTTIIGTIEANRPALESFAGGIQEAFDLVGFAVRNFGPLLEITLIKAREVFTNIGITVMHFPVQLGQVAEYIGTNWYALIKDGINATALLFINLANNVGEFAEAVWNFLADPTGGFQFNFTPLLEGFKATADQLPELIKPALISLQDEMDTKFLEIANKETKRAQGLAQIGVTTKKAAAMKAAAKGPEDKTDKTPFGEAVTAGSKEAYSAIVTARFRQGSDDSIKAVAKTSAQQLQVAKDQLNETRATKTAIMAMTTGAAALGVVF